MSFFTQCVRKCTKFYDKEHVRIKLKSAKFVDRSLLNKMKADMNHEIETMKGSKLTPLGVMVNKLIGSWHTTTVLSWVTYWGIIYFCVMVGVGKVVNIALSMLGEWLTANFELGAVMGIYFVIGICMFLLPPVPGIPVYLIGGLIIPNMFSVKLGGWGGPGEEEETQFF